jgi:hypothetical protein
MSSTSASIANHTAALSARNNHRYPSGFPRRLGDPHHRQRHRTIHQLHRRTRLGRMARHSRHFANPHTQPTRHRSTHRLEALPAERGLPWLPNLHRTMGKHRQMHPMRHARRRPPVLQLYRITERRPRKRERRIRHAAKQMLPKSAPLRPSCRLTIPAERAASRARVIARKALDVEMINFAP